VHADRHQHVGELFFQRPQLIQHMQAVDAAERPEIQQHDLAAQVLQAHLLAACIQPATANQLRRPDPSLPLDRRGHIRSQHEPLVSLFLLPDGRSDFRFVRFRLDSKHDSDHA
jgi:hypothetical protein